MGHNHIGVYMSITETAAEPPQAEVRGLRGRTGGPVAQEIRDIVRDMAELRKKLEVLADRLETVVRAIGS